MADVLWAPWRLGFVQGTVSEEPGPEPEYEFLAGADRDCFLCQAVADRAPDAEKWRHVLTSSEHTIVVLNKYPYNNGHLLVAPRRHVGDLTGLTSAERSELMEEVTRMVERLRAALHPQGFNVGINLGSVAGAGLPGHLHIHIVPRWNGDTNFMPAVGGIKVIPQSLDALWDILYTPST